MVRLFAVMRPFHIYRFRRIVPDNCLSPVVRSAAPVMHAGMEARTVPARMPVALMPDRRDAFRVYPNPLRDEQHGSLHKFGSQHIAYACVVRGEFAFSHSAIPATFSTRICIGARSPEKGDTYACGSPCTSYFVPSGPSTASSGPTTVPAGT